MEDEEGFLFPNVNEEQCVDCGICAKICPSLSQTLNSKASKAISAYSKDERISRTASSGGFFTNLALFYLEKGGKVYGAAFDKKLQLKHVGVNKKEDLWPLSRSKYLQSDSSGVYNQIKSDLKKGIKVLFCGTPCQCQALSNYIGEQLKENLLIVDFACHGVSCQALFDDNIDWNSKRYGEVLNYTFRYKEAANYHHFFCIKYKKNDGKIKKRTGTYYKDPYYYGYEKRFMLRNSCYNCKWVGTYRCSDFTLADFFGIEDVGLDLKSEYISCILPNTEKGQRVFDEVKDLFDGVYVFPVEFPAQNNECLRQNIKKPSNRDEFFKKWKDKGFDYAVKNYLTPKHRWIFDIYYGTPKRIRTFVRKLLKR